MSSGPNTLSKVGGLMIAAGFLAGIEYGLVVALDVSLFLGAAFALVFIGFVALAAGADPESDEEVEY